MFCWGLSVLFRNGPDFPGFAREVLVGHPVWCMSVLFGSVRVLCFLWLVVERLSPLCLGLGWLIGLVGLSP